MQIDQLRDGLCKEKGMDEGRTDKKRKEKKVSVVL